MNNNNSTLTLSEIALHYKNKFGLDFIPLIITKKSKRPDIKKWEHLQVNEQSIEELKTYSWLKANGIGMINKIIATLDFDKCKDVLFIKMIAKELGGRYWIVKTGNGYHLHFRIERIEYLETILGKKGTFYLNPIDKSILDHIELRIKDCYTTFPYSMHYNGSIYYFIEGEPENLPDKISAQKLIEVLKNHFVINEKKENDVEKSQEGFYEDFNSGVKEGKRHNILTKIFGTFYSRGIDKKYLTTMLKDWNRKNKPPIPENELTKQINDLFRRYDRGLDGIFLQFNNCLLQLQDDYKLKLEKIICFGVIEYECDKKIIEELKLEDKINEYHKECKNLVKRYEGWTGKKDQIVRIGKSLILDTYKKNIRFEYFCVYVGIISYLGRNSLKPAKQISHNIIQFRAMGFKNETEFLRSESTTMPYTPNTIRSAIKKIEDTNLIRTFSLVKGRMKWFSTFYSTNETLAEWVKNREIKKLRKNKEKDLLRVKMQEQIQAEENELKDLINKKKIVSSSSSLHLVSDEN